MDIAALDVKMVPVADLHPYERNTKSHSKKQISNVARSIKKFGFVQPLVIDKNGVIVIGHCRYAAAKKNKMKEVPCVCVDDLSDQQVRELRIVDNKTNESDWIENILNIELDDLNLDGFDFEFDFGDDDIEYEESEEEAALRAQDGHDHAQERRSNILQLAHGQYEGDNPFDFPDLAPVYELPEITEWIDFDEVIRCKNPEGKGVHFFCDDYKFERVWNQPERYVDKLRQFAVVATPDFSPFGDMPLIAQMWNHYRKHWVGAFLQERGVTVIPTIRASTDPRSLDWFLDGEPRGGIVIMSSMWTQDEESEINITEYQTMKEVLQPKKIFIYGRRGHMGIEDDDPVEFIERSAFRRCREDG